MKCVWHSAKATENLLKHGVTFDEAAVALDDPLAVEELDGRFDYGEDRILAIAMGLNVLLAIVYTERDGSYRIISARRATRDEQDRYYRQNAL